MPGALLTSIALSEVNRLATDPQLRRQPGRLLQALNRRIKETLQQGGAERENAGDDGMDAAFVWIDRSGRRLLAASAKLPVIVIDVAGEATVLRGDRRSLGYRNTPTDFLWTEHDMATAPGMRLALATDGFSDQIGEAAGFGFGWSRLEGILAKTQGGRPGPGGAIWQALLDWQGGQMRRDDVQCPDRRHCERRLECRKANFAAIAGGGEVIFYYVGYFSQAIIEASADAIRLQPGAGQPSLSDPTAPAVGLHRDGPEHRPPLGGRPDRSEPARRRNARRLHPDRQGRRLFQTQLLQLHQRRCAQPPGSQTGHDQPDGIGGDQGRLSQHPAPRGGRERQGGGPGPAHPGPRSSDPLVYRFGDDPKGPGRRLFQLLITV